MVKIKSFQDIKKEERQRRIDSILNYDGYTKLQKKNLDNFYAYLQRKGLRQESQRAYLQKLKTLFKKIGKDIGAITRKDIDKYLLSLNQYAQKTQTECRKFLLTAFEWYYDKPKNKINLISDIVVKKDKNMKLPEEILSPEEIKKIVEVADNFRDKAIIMLLYELGARKGEFLQIKIKHCDITNSKYGLVTIPMGKTDSRKLPIIYSIPHLKNWLNSHPARDDPDAPLFITKGSWLGRGLGDDGLKMIVKRLGKRANIKKRIYPHLFRHSRLTELGKELTEQELKKFAGWTAASEMAAIYVHLSGQDVSNKLLANAGLISQDKIKLAKNILQTIMCPRCKKANPSDAKYCDCGCCLDIREAQKVAEAQEEEAKKKDNELEAIKKEIIKMKKQSESIMAKTINKEIKKLMKKMGN